MRRDEGRMSAFLAIVLLVALAAVVMTIFPFRQILAQKETVRVAEEKLTALRAENDRLEAEVEMLSTPAEMERLAREQLGVVRPGQTSYVVHIPEGTAAEPERVVIPESDLDTTPWWEDFWDFLTGRDLVVE